MKARIQKVRKPGEKSRLAFQQEIMGKKKANDHAQAMQIQFATGLLVDSYGVKHFQLIVCSCSPIGEFEPSDIYICLFSEEFLSQETRKIPSIVLPTREREKGKKACQAFILLQVILTSLTIPCWGDSRTTERASSWSEIISMYVVR